jgi:hypothetical protein
MALAPALSLALELALVVGVDDRLKAREDPLVPSYTQKLWMTPRTKAAYLPG